MKTIAIERLAPDSPEIADRIQRSVPFVTRVRWPAHDRWTVDYIVERCGPKQVMVFRKRDGGDTDKVEVEVAEYLRLVSDPSWGKRYELLGVPQTRLWFEGAPDPGLGGLLDDIAVPAFVDRARLQSINLWLQGGRYDNGNHYDPNALQNFNVQVAGRKRWRLFDPNLGGVFPVKPALGEMTPPLISSYTPHPDDCRTNPGYDRAICHEAILEPGDAIYVPAFYMHWVVHESDLHININFWWAPETVPLASLPVGWALLNGLLSVFRRRMPGASLAEVCAALAALPPDTRQLLLELERALLYEPDLLTPARARSLRTGTGGPRLVEGVEVLRDRNEG